MKRITLCLLFILAIATSAHAKSMIKYSVMMLHYNLQYVAGDEVIENKIIQHSLDPMVDFFLEHPGWGANFEMQGYMLEQTALRYPETFKKLKILIDRGQIDLVTFHYSDQLFMAYPRRDMAWSEILNRKTLSDLGLKRSGTVFTQEGQAGEGMASYMKDNGFDIMCFPKNLYRYWHKNEKPMPYYSLRGIHAVLCGQGVDFENNNTVVKLNWTFFNDAELLPTGGATPYAKDFGKSEQALAEYAERLAKLEQDGYVIGTIGQYVNALKLAGIPAATLKPVLDGDWQPIDTHNIFRWMGDYHFQYERDNEVLTTNVKVRHKVLAAETMIYSLKKEHDITELQAGFMEAIRYLMLAEVSDSTGWTPWEGEIKYSLSNAKRAEEIADEIIARGKELMNTPYVQIDTSKGKVTPVANAPGPPAVLPQYHCPIDIELTGKIKKQQVKCFRADKNVWEIIVKFKTTEWHSNNFRLKFPRTFDKIVYSPALTDDLIVSYDLSSFEPENGAWMYVPCPNGLIGLGPDLFLIKDTSTVNVTFNVPVDEPVVSLDMLKPPNRVFEWRFLLVIGPADLAVKKADAMNVHPVEVY